MASADQGQDEFARLPAQVAMYRAARALLAGDIPDTAFHAGRILELAEPSDHFRLGGTAPLTGPAEWTTGDLDAARRNGTEGVAHVVGGMVMGSPAPLPDGCA